MDEFGITIRTYQKVPDAEYGVMCVEAKYNNITEMRMISIAYPFYEQRLAWAKRVVHKKLRKRVLKLLGD